MDLRNTIVVPEVAPTAGAWGYIVKARDEFSCRQCGASGEGVKLNAHHKDTTSNLRLVVSNGICLCRNCHCKAHNGTFTKTPRRKWNKAPKRIEIQVPVVVITISNIAKLLDVSISSLCDLIENESTRRKLARQAQKEALKIVAKHAAYNTLIEKIFEKREALAQVSFEKEIISG